MHNIEQWVKDHPYMAGTLVLGIVVLWVIIRRNAAAAQDTSGVVYSGPSDALQAAELQYGSAISQTQLAAQAQMAGYDAAVRTAALSDAATVAQATIAGGVQDTSTAAQLQYGLATLGFSPSVSPFGQTVPISGLPSSYFSPLKGPVTNPSNPYVPASGCVYDGVQWHCPTTTSSYTGNQAPPTSPGPGYMWDGTSWRYVGTTGSTGTVLVPSVPVYGPVNAAGQPTILGVTSGGVIPSSSNQTWAQYDPRVMSAFNTSSVSPWDVATATAAQIAAENDYLYNPLSCHNRVC